MEHDHRAGAHFERHEVAGRRWRRQRRRVELLELRAVVGGVALEDLAQRPAVAARLGPQAAVVERGVLDREPEPGDGDRVGVQERGVLVAADLAADARLLEDVHRLQRERVGEADVGGDLGDVGVVGEALEHASRSCSAWPILLMLSSFGWRSSPSGPNASSSKKHQVLDPLARNSPLEMRSCSLVVNTERSSDGSHASTISSARSRSRSARVDRHEVGQDEEPVTVDRTRSARRSAHRNPTAAAKCHVPSSQGDHSVTLTVATMSVWRAQNNE